MPVGAALEHPEIAVAAGVHEPRHHAAVARQVDQQGRRYLVPVPRVVPVILVMGLQRARLDVERDDGVRVKVVPGARVAGPRARIARAPIGESELGIEAARDPHRRATRAPRVAGPGVVAGLAGRRHRVALPDLLARLGIERDDEAANAALAARDADHDAAACRERRDRHVVAVVVILDGLVPDDGAALRIERDDARVGRRRVDLVAVQRDAAIRRVAHADVGGHLMPIAPEEVAGLGVDREDLVERRRHEHHAVVDDRRRLMAFSRARRHRPRGRQVRDVARVDSRERAVAPGVVLPQIHEPVARLRRLEPSVRHGAVASSVLRAGRERGQRQAGSQSQATVFGDHRDSYCGGAALNGSSGLESDAAFERTGDGERSVDDLQRQCRELPRRRAADDTRAVARIELRLVARALEAQHVAVPVRDVAARMRADAGVRDDAVCGTRARLVAELLGGQPHDDELIQPRAVADAARRRMHRIGEQLLRAERDVGRRRRPVRPCRRRRIRSRHQPAAVRRRRRSRRRARRRARRARGRSRLSARGGASSFDARRLFRAAPACASPELQASSALCGEGAGEHNGRADPENRDKRRPRTYRKAKGMRAKGGE